MNPGAVASAASKASGAAGKAANTASQAANAANNASQAANVANNASQAANVANNTSTASNVANKLSENNPITGQGTQGGDMMQKVGSVINSADDQMSKLIPDSLIPGDNKPEVRVDENGNTVQVPKPAPGKKKKEDMTSSERKEADAKGGETDEKSSTNKTLQVAARGVAAYFTGGQSLGADKAVVNSKTGGKLFGVVSDTLDKTPGVKQATKAIDDVGVTDTAEGALDVVASVKNKDLGGIAEGAEKVKKGTKKARKQIMKMVIMSLIAFLLPVLLIIIVFLVIFGPIIGGFIDLTDNKSNISYGVLSNIDYGDYTLDSSDDTILHEPLDTFLSNHGSSLEEFNNLIAQNVRQQGCGTNAGVAAAAVTLIGTLGDNYNVKLPYYWGGGHEAMYNGAAGKWGSSACHTYANNQNYNYCGLDCSGFVGWAIKNGGVNLSWSKLAGDYQHLPGAVHVNLSSSQAVVGPGDLLENDHHVTMVVAVDEATKTYKIAHASGNSTGVLFGTVPFGSSNYWGVAMSGYYSTHGKSSC